jgi:hypothetical protein
MVVNWLRSAAIIAQKDPVAGGYLTKDERGRIRLPPLHGLASLPIQRTLSDEPNLLVEYGLHNLRMPTALTDAVPTVRPGAA